MKVAPIINTLYMGTSREVSGFTFWHDSATMASPAGCGADHSPTVRRLLRCGSANKDPHMAPRKQVTKRTMARRKAAKRELIDTGRRKLYVRLNRRGTSRHWFNSNHNGQTDRPARPYRLK